MSQKPEDDDLEPEYDFSRAARGKYFQIYQQGTNVVLSAVTIQLTEEQQQAIVSAEDTPPKVVAPRTGAAYVLIPLADYEVVREIMEEERRQEVIRKLAIKNAAGRTQKKT